MKGDFYIDFAVAAVLFVLAFSSIFFYYNSEFDLKIQDETKETASLKIQNIIDSLERETVEKRIIIINGSSNNEFVNLSGYDIDLILYENENRKCFDPHLEGFITNVTTEKKFYLYSTEKFINKHTCQITNFTNSLSEQISTPIYEEYVERAGTYEGSYCEQKTFLKFTEYGPEELKTKICS